ncbi:tetratricopeptide repeat protein [Anaerococcus cruorum]|uniref:tetratricopeptide repeat protein n=1 Tax=Anaerococcus sp. WGS1529 TaxID=3366812 RepID=UPI00372D03AC
MKQIFVSSTFKDMHIERDLIQTKLSPDLNEKAYQKRIEGIKFQDLRWGIDTDIENEEEKDKKILEVCLDEIENNRPYFMVLVGDRYGWIPDNDLVKETGVRYGIYSPDEKIEKSITNLEIDYGFLKNPQYAKHSFAYIRNIVGDLKGTIYEQDPEEKEKIEKLKKEIRQVLPAENIHEYDVTYKDGYLVGVDKFVDFATEDMTRVLLENQIIKEDLTDTQKEILYHKTQADEKSVISNARKAIEDQIVKEIAKNNVITVKGKSGNGKSTLMAKISERVNKKYNSIILFSSLTPKTTSPQGMMRVITEYINETLRKEDMAIDFSKILEDFEEEDASQGVKKEDESKDEKLYETALREYFKKGKREIIILIDAIDQLDNPAGVAELLKPLNFTNDSKIKFIISYLEDEDEKVNDTYIFLNDYLNFKLDKLNTEDKLEVINSSLTINNKELPLEIKQEIVDKKGSSSPLYISLLVQRLLMMNREDYLRILRAGDGYEKITTYQKNLIQQMPSDLKELILDIISHASKNLKTNTDDVQRTISYLAVSRRGLRESDLKKIYELQGDNYNSLDFATLKKYLRAFFLEDKYLRIDFTHKIIRQAVLEVLSEEKQKRYHNDIANAFITLPIEDPIKLQEQYYSAYKSHNVEAGADILNKIGNQYGRLTPQEIDTAIESITKIHNVSIDNKDDEWMKKIFIELSKFGLEAQKILLTYFVYSAYEEKTRESLIATKYNGKGILEYLEVLVQTHTDDKQLMSLYADQSAYLGMKYDIGSKSDMKQSERYLLNSLKVNKKLYDLDKNTSNKENVANAYSNIGRFYLDVSPCRRDESSKYYQKSLTMFQEIAEDEPNIVNKENLAMAYNDIANLYSTGDGEEFKNAKYYYKQSIDIIKKLLDDHDDINLKKTLALAYINIASLCFTQNKFDRAERWYYRSIDILKEIEQEEPSLENKETLGKTYNNIADLFASELIDDRKKAEDFYFKAIRIFEGILKLKAIISVKKSLSITYDNIGNLYADWKIEEAYGYYKKAIALKEDLLTSSSSKEAITDLATSYNNLGFLYVDNRADDDYAIFCYKRSIELMDTIEESQTDKSYGENLATCYTNLASLYFMLGDSKNSEKYYTKAIDIHKRLIKEFKDDDNIEKLLIIYNNLACNQTDLDYPLSVTEDLYLEVIELIKILQDPYKKRKKTAITYNNLGNLYLIKDKNYALCEKCYLKSIDLTKWVIDYHKSVENEERLMVNYSNLAELYIRWGKEEQARTYLNLAIETANAIDYKNNQENINKFIYQHENF